MTQRRKKKLPPTPDEALAESAGDADPPTQSELAAWPRSRSALRSCGA